MNKVLVVDDEPITRANVTSLLVKEGFMVEQAADGGEMIEKSAAFQPDVVLVDIEIPVLNGLEAVGHLRQRCPAAEFIVISAYDYFNYVQQALRLGARDYLLKPVMPRDLLGSVKAAMAEKRNPRGGAAQEDPGQGKAMFSLLRHSGGLISEAEVRRDLGMAGLSGTEELLIIILCGQGLEEQATLLGAGKSLALTARLRGRKACGCFWQNRYYLAVEARGDGQRLLADLFAAGDLPDVAALIAACGGPAHSLSGYLSALREAEAKVKARCWGQAAQPGAGPSCTEGVAERLARLLAPPNLQDICAVIDNTLASSLYLAAPQMVACEIGYNLIRYAGEARRADYTYRLERGLGTARDAAEVRLVLCDLARAIAAEHEEAAASAKKEAIAAAMEYILANLHHRELSLQDVARHVYWSPGYFSRIFKEETGRPFSRFVMEERAKQAKRLLARKGVSIKEIAYATGYDDSNYFCRVFKQVTGLSPTLWRRVNPAQQ